MNIIYSNCDKEFKLKFKESKDVITYAECFYLTVKILFHIFFCCSIKKEKKKKKLINILS